VANKVSLSPEGDELHHGKLMRGPDAEAWAHATYDDFDRLIERTRTLTFIPYAEKPVDRPASNFVQACTDKIKMGIRKKRVRGTHGGRTDYTGGLAAYVASAPTVKIHLNSVISTPGAKFATADITDFYLNTPLPQPEYLKIRRNQIPQQTWDKYDLDTIAYDNGNAVMARLDKTIPGLPQSGIISQNALVKHIGESGYHLSDSCIITHDTRPISATLIVDDFGIKYINDQDLHHFLDTLRAKYDITVDLTGEHYIGFDLLWEYEGPRRRVELSMPRYIPKLLASLNFVKLPRDINNPTSYTAPVYAAAQFTTPTDSSKPLNAQAIKRLQSIVGSIGYYAQVLDSTMLTPVRLIASDQAKPTETVQAAADHLLQYAATWPNATLTFYPSDMQLKISSDATHLSEPQAGSRAGGLHYLGDDAAKSQWVNGAIDILSRRINVVVSSAYEAEIGSSYLNAVESLSETRVLELLGHLQPPTEILCDNRVAVDVCNGHSTQRRHKSIDMRFEWLICRTQQGQFSMKWIPGVNNPADYFTKKHPTKHHQAMRRFFVTDPPRPSANTAKARHNMHRRAKRVQILT
jgi:hypothetical protein